VRHVRMLGLCLVAAFAVSAMAAVPALAHKESFEQYLNTNSSYEVYKYCPYANAETENCYFAQTSGGKNGGFFELGGVRVPLSKPITLQGGFYGVGAGIKLLPATNGGETLESPELKVPGGLGLITPRIEEQAEWPASLMQAAKEAKRNKEAGLDVKIELAGGNRLYELTGALDSENLLEEEGPAYQLPLKVKITGPFLASLGGGPCEIGNEEHPIMQDLTSEGSGAAGSFAEGFEFFQVGLNESRLVALNWPVEIEAAAKGCGGAYESYVDHALNILLEVASHPEGATYYGRTGLTVLQGHLMVANTEGVKAQFEDGFTGI
jgi:hypothetical protein